MHWRCFATVRSPSPRSCSLNWKPFGLRWTASTVEIAEELTSADAGPDTVPSISFEVVNNANGMRSGRVTVRIARLSATAAHAAADGLEVSVKVKGSREGQDRHGEDLLPALGLDRRTSLDQAIAEQIVRHAFGRVAGV